VNLAEVVTVLVRHRRLPADEVIEKLRWLVLGGLKVVPADESIGLRAGALHARHYHRARRPVSLADCVALATALELRQRLATSDPDLLAAAQDEGCALVALLDGTGNRPAIDV
jgi:predicted nucleic acid-binding protein